LVSPLTSTAGLAPFPTARNRADMAVLPDNVTA
jgi:hypothetical protein